MNSKSSINSERNTLDKLKKFQLPNKVKIVGWVIFGIAFVALFLTTKDTSAKLFAKYSILIGLLIVSISKEKIEDELVKNLRMQSFTFAFIFAVFITISNPLFSYLANLMFEKQQDPFNGIGDWMIMWFLLSVQVFSFEYLKKNM